jgi:hypothetical protein
LDAAARICQDDSNEQSIFVEMAKDEFDCTKEVLAAERSEPAAEA